MTETEAPAKPSSGLRLLFVCSGNTCRSPMAEVLARRMAEEGDLPVESVRSSGTSTVSGLPASDGARRAVDRHGLSLEDHVSAPISSGLLEWADVVLVMGPSHLRRAREMGAGAKAFLLRAFAEGREEDRGRHHFAVPDPFGGDDDLYEETFLSLEGLIQKALERLVKGENPQ